MVIYQGDTFRGTLWLRTKDPVDPCKQTPFQIPVGSTVQVKLPGAGGVAVVLSTANTGEVSVTGTLLDGVQFVGGPTKSANLLVGEKQSINCVVTDPTGAKTTFQLDKVITVKVPANV